MKHSEGPSYTTREEFTRRAMLVMNGRADELAPSHRRPSPTGKRRMTDLALFYIGMVVGAALVTGIVLFERAMTW